MSLSITYYSLLGVSETATIAEIKKAYRVKARTQHPDVQRQNGFPADETTFQLINEAYKILSDEKSREEYDRSLQTPPEEPQNEEPTWGEETEETWEEDTTDNNEEILDEDIDVEEDPYDVHDYPTYDNTYPHAYGWEDSSLSETKSVIYPQPQKTKILLPISLGSLALIWLGYLIIFMSVNSEETIFPLILAILFTLPTGIVAIPPRTFEKIPPLKAMRGIVYGLGGLAIIASFIVPIVIPQAILAIIAYLSMRLLVKSKYGSNLISENNSNIRTWGKPGDLAGAAKKFGYNNIKWGIKGEQKTASLLSVFPERLETATVFHGLRFPGSTNADVDHAVLYGNRLALIDSKMWKPALYEFGSGYIEIHDFDGGDMETRTTHFHEAVSKYSEMFPNLEVKGWYFIHSTQPNENIQIGEYNKLGETILSHPEDGMEEVGQWLVESKNKKKNVINRKNIYKMLCHLK